MRSTHQNLTGLLAIAIIFIATATAVAEFPASIQTVLDNTQPLQHPRRGRLPLFVLPISHALSGSSNEDAEAALRELDRRGIGYTVDWNPGDFDASLAEGLRIARLQSQLGLLVGVNANTCLYSFSDGSPETLHVDSNGQTFAEASFGTPVGCPFALEHRIPVIKERVERFLRAYRDAGVTIDFVFADWEIDGPIEWNDAWAGCQRCSRCRDRIRNIDDFRAFQRQLRQVRSELQRVTLGDNVRAYFPEALVGNYGVTPHGGIRHWYDYFERETPGAPFVADRRAKYREWAHEFDATGYTFAMPVVYTWYPTYGWYDFADTDYRWFYNMLLVGSDAGEFTPAETPIITFVHWHTTAPPENPDPSVRQFSREKYQDLLWHLLLRGHDAFFLWCQQDELAEEVRLVHEVYAAALEHHGFLERGTPITFDVPQQQTDVVSGLRIGDQVLVRHTPIGSDSPAPLQLTLADGSDISVPATADNQIVTVRPRERRSGLLTVNDQPAIPIGCYELPADEAALKEMAEAGINLVHCNNRADLDRAQAAGLQGWISVAVQQGDTPDLRQRVASVADHPALAVWEGPDEIVWTFTAYSTLAKSVGITRDDWNNQTEKAVRYSEEQAATIIPNMRAGIAAIRELDPQKRPFWMNEAADSDLKFVRQYEDSCDVIGCDYYAVRSSGTDLQSVGRLVDRWDTLGRGQPVWMVLQGFSWHTAHPQRTRLYPTFAESRFMAYDSLVHGARAVLYWGTNMIDEPKFRQSLYALTSELSALQPFLVAEPHDGVRATVVDDLFDPPSTKGVRAQLLRHGTDYLLILVNEDPHRHLGIDVTGLDMLDGRELKQLYGGETATVQQHGFTTRLQGFEVKLFATNAARYESPRIDGRAYDGE